MPYITQARRRGLKDHCDQIAEIVRTEDLGQAALIEIVWVLCSSASGLGRLPTTLDYAGVVESPLSKLVMELTARSNKCEAIGGDLNFSICRILVGSTQVHVEPAYEDKIQLIDEVIDYTQRTLFKDFDNPTKINETLAWVLGVLKCAGRELYRRYGVPYEDQARQRADSGDIMD